MTAPEEQAVPVLTPEALDTIEADIQRGLQLKYQREDGGVAGILAALAEDGDLMLAELRRLRTENEEQGRRIAAALLASRDSRYPASSFDIIVALTGEATE